MVSSGRPTDLVATAKRHEHIGKNDPRSKSPPIYTSLLANITDLHRSVKEPAVFSSLLYVFLLVFFFQSITFAQLTPVNESGVTMGHIHLFVPDPKAHRKLWTGLFGAQVDKTGALEVLKLPGIDLLTSKGSLPMRLGSRPRITLPLWCGIFLPLKASLLLPTSRCWMEKLRHSLTV